MLVGKEAPDFIVNAVVEGKIINNFSLSSIQGKYRVLFFYPLDFTFVCPTELHAFQDHLLSFQERGVEILGCSVDSCFSHLAWLNLPRNQGGIAGISYPLLSDINKQIARSYGVLKEDEGIAYRGLFLIDQQGIIRHETVNDLPLGRSVQEVLRMIDALMAFDKYGEVCPANWQPGEKMLKPDQEGLIEYFTTV